MHKNFLYYSFRHAYGVPPSSKRKALMAPSLRELSAELTEGVMQNDEQFKICSFIAEYKNSLSNAFYFSILLLSRHHHPRHLRTTAPKELSMRSYLSLMINSDGICLRPHGRHRRPDKEIKKIKSKESVLPTLDSENPVATYS